MEERGDRIKKFVRDCFKTKTPIFVITDSDEWISGYLDSEPSELYCEILDWKEKEVRKIHYSRIHKALEFRGDYSQLPIPKYLRGDK